MTEGINFQSEWLDNCPTGILVIDADERISWINKTLRQMLEIGSDELIGFDCDSLPSDTYQVLIKGDPVLHLRSDEGDERWLRCEISEVVDQQRQPAKVHYYQDISEQMMAQLACDSLLERVNELTLTDELTGLANQRALSHALVSQVTRSRRYGNPLSLMFVRIDGANELADSTLLAISHNLRERLRWADFIGRYEDDLFMMILPETNQESLQILRQKIELEVPGCVPGEVFELSIGTAEWEKGFDPRKLIEKALQDLARQGANITSIVQA